MLVQGQFGERIFDVSGKSKQKKLLVHDFNVPEINVTPSVFRVIRDQVSSVSDCWTLIRDKDQSFVLIRPKFYIGSNGTVWASDFIRIRTEYPTMFESVVF